MNHNLTLQSNLFFFWEAGTVGKTLLCTQIWPVNHLTNTPFNNIKVYYEDGHGLNIGLNIEYRESFHCMVSSNICTSMIVYHNMAISGVCMC